MTQHNDLGRTGQNTSETILTPSNVNVGQFGKIFALPVDGQVYAQPLYVPNVAFTKGSHNVLVVATENDSVYAFDADSNTGANTKPLWRVSMVDAAHGAGAGERPLLTSTSIHCTDLHPKIGITSTPVIDPVSRTIYVEAKSTDGTNYFHRLHSLDLTTGKEKSPGPTLITATVSGTGDGSHNGILPFDSLHQQNRPGLLLVNGTIYVAFASHCDFRPYHGWLFAYDTATLSQQGVFVTNPNGGLAGIWMSGAGLAAEANGNIFVATGNGDFKAADVPTEVGDSILKIALTNGNLAIQDYFTPFDEGALNQLDGDLGSGGVLLLPDQPGNHPHMLVQAGKEGLIRLVDRDTMTANNLHYCKGCSSDSQIVQHSGFSEVGGMWSMPAYWNNTLYFCGANDVLKAVPLNNGLLDFGHVTNGPDNFGFPGATPSISSNGDINGIVWVIDSSQYGFPGPVPSPAVLHAFNAADVTQELYNSSQAIAARDQAGNAVKFTVPTIVNGKVYVPTSSEVDVYGLLTGAPH